MTYPLTVGAGANRALAVFVVGANGYGTASAPNISSITYAGVPLTQVTHHFLYGGSIYGGTYMDLWALPAGTQPATGTNNVVVTFPAGSSISYHSAAYSATGVDQTTTFRSYGANDGVGVTATLIMPTSNPQDLVVDMVCQGAGVNSTSNVQKFIDKTSNTVSCDEVGGAVASGDVTNLEWTLQSADSWILMGAAFKGLP